MSTADPAVIAAWTTALRSGEYEQTAGMLRRSLDTGPDGFCCWGVLCDLYQKAYPDLTEWDPDGDFVIKATDTSNTLTMPAFAPDCVWTWALGEIDLDDEDDWGLDLAQLNDAGTPFDTIADIIESHVAL